MTYFLCNLLEKRYVIFIISWHCSLGGNFLADALRYLSWPALSRSWHLAASGMGLGVMSHQAGLLTTLHHIHICFPEQGGNMVTTMGWGFSDFRHLFCITRLINKACMYHNHIPLMYIFNSPANECWVSFSFKLISRVFDERDQRDKAKKKPSSSESRPPRSLSHRSPLDSISRPKPKDSYNQQPGQSFCRPPKQSPYKSRTGTQSKNQTFTRDGSGQGRK